MMAIDFKKMLEPFGKDDIEWRIGRGGEKNNKIWATCLCYVTNRAVQDRLDQVCGPENWQDQYIEWKGGQLCGISIKIDGEWVTKWDGASDTAIESLKGGLSDAEKRAAVKWGIGRYLYKLDEGFANINSKGRLSGKIKVGGQNKYFDYDPPKLPSWAVPADESPPGTTGRKVSDSTASTMEDETKATTKNFKYLKTMADLKKKIGEPVYYIILKEAGFKHANEILASGTQEIVWRQMNQKAGGK